MAKKEFKPGDNVYVLELDENGDGCFVECGYMILATVEENAIVTYRSNRVKTLNGMLKRLTKKMINEKPKEIFVVPLADCFSELKELIFENIMRSGSDDEDDED